MLYVGIILFVVTPGFPDAEVFHGWLIDCPVSLCASRAILSGEEILTKYDLVDEFSVSTNKKLSRAFPLPSISANPATMSQPVCAQVKICMKIVPFEPNYAK